MLLLFFSYTNSAKLRVHIPLPDDSEQEKLD